MMTRAALTAAVSLPALAFLACNSDSPSRGQDPPSPRLDIAVCAPTAGPFSADITNPFFNLPVGTRWVLEGREGGELLRLEVTSLPATELVAGVACRVVEERETVDGELAEVSRNFFAQTADGTVCYYGEDVDIYEEGEIASHDGAWRAGGANQPGIFMPANPRVGQEFQQEVAPGVAVDEATVVALGETVVVPLGTFTDTLRVEDRNPLDGDRGEKVYARGRGLLIDGDVLRIE